MHVPCALYPSPCIGRFVHEAGGRSAVVQWRTATKWKVIAPAIINARRRRKCARLTHPRQSDASRCAFSIFPRWCDSLENITRIPFAISCLRIFSSNEISEWRTNSCQARSVIFAPNRKYNGGELHDLFRGARNNRSSSVFFLPSSRRGASRDLEKYLPSIFCASEIYGVESFFIPFSRTTCLVNSIMLFPLDRAIPLYDSPESRSMRRGRRDSESGRTLL